MNSSLAPPAVCSTGARPALCRFRLALHCCVLLLAITLPMAGHAQHFVIYTHSLDKQSEVIDGQLRGREHAGKRAFYLELVNALLLEMQHPQPIIEVPLARGLAELQARDNVVLFNLSKTQERQPMAYWLGPTLKETDYLYESSQRPTGIQTLEEARDLEVCVLNGSSHDEKLSALGFTRLQRNNAYANCFGMLAAGRVALVASADVELEQKLHHARVPLDAVKASPVQLGSDQGYIALSRSMSPQAIALWREAFERLRRDGRLQALYERYALPATAAPAGR